ncbi:MAG: hypothetical protein AAB397_01415 [Patescibacteria group bacterium]
MKNLTKIGFIVTIVTMAFLTINCNNRTGTEFKFEKSYTIEQVSQEIFCIKGLKVEEEPVPRGSVFLSGYGTALNEGLREITKNYQIENITPIIWTAYGYSLTKELIVQVKPK